MNSEQTYFFLGIGGIGMSALARYFKAQGCTVNGYDRTRSELTKELEEEGIGIIYDDETKDKRQKTAALKDKRQKTAALKDDSQDWRLISG